MNNQIQDFARQSIKDGLVQLPQEQQMMFKQMYSHNNLKADINTVIINIPEDKLDWAMQQVERSLKKLQKKGEK